MSGPEFGRKKNEARLIASKGSPWFFNVFFNVCGQKMPKSGESKWPRNRVPRALNHSPLPGFSLWAPLLSSLSSCHQTHQQSASWMSCIHHQLPEPHSSLVPVPTTPTKGERRKQMKRRAYEFEKWDNPITLQLRCAKVGVCYPQFLLCYVFELDLSFLPGLPEYGRCLATSSTSP